MGPDAYPRGISDSVCEASSERRFGLLSVGRVYGRSEGENKDGLRALYRQTRLAFLSLQSRPQRVTCFSLASHARAKEALEFGLSTAEPGFNIFVAGADRSGRLTQTMAFSVCGNAEAAACSGLALPEQFSGVLTGPGLAKYRPARGGDSVNGWRC